MATGLDLFKAVVKDFRSVTGLVAKGAVAAPLADFVLKVGPPWPSASPIITALLELIVLIGAFEFWYASPRKRQRRRMILLFTTLVTFYLIYFFVSSQYTTKHPVSGNTLAHGYTIRSDVRAAMEPGDDIYDLLSGSEFKPEEIWTTQSIAVVRIGLLTSWLGLFSSLAGFIAVFVMIQRRIVVQPRRRKKRRPANRNTSKSAPTTASDPLQIVEERPMSDDSLSSAAERIRNHGERLSNAGDSEGARAARDAAREAERATPERAREIERDFNRGNDRPAGPSRGPGT
jgi:hypothetical protein